MNYLTLISLALFLAAWNRPSAPQNYPTEGTAAAWIASEACTPEKTAGCIGFSGLSPRWVLPGGARPPPRAEARCVAAGWPPDAGGGPYVWEPHRYWYLAANVGPDNHLFILNQMNYAVI